MLTGLKPYKADTPMAVVVKHINDPIPRLEQFNIACPLAVQQVINQALAKNPDERYASMDAFGAALKNLTALTPREISPASPGRNPLQGKPAMMDDHATVDMQTPPPFERMGLFSQKQRPRVAAALGVFVLVLAGVAGFILYQNGLPTPPVTVVSNTPTPKFAPTLLLAEIMPTDTALPSVLPTVLPSMTPPGSIAGPANQYLPVPADFETKYEILQNDTGMEMLTSQTTLPISAENLGRVSFQIAPGLDPTFYPDPHRKQNGVYLILKYAVFILGDEKMASLYLNAYSQQDIVSRALLVITPLSLVDKNARLIDFSTNQDGCAENRSFKFLPAALGGTPSALTKGVKTALMTPTADTAGEALYLFASCRVKNVVIALWGETYNNLDGRNTPLPDTTLNEQINGFFQKVIKKLPK